MHCIKCGKKLIDEALFCPYCGYRVIDMPVEPDIKSAEGNIPSSDNNNPNDDREPTDPPTDGLEYLRFMTSFGMIIIAAAYAILAWGYLSGAYWGNIKSEIYSNHPFVYYADIIMGVCCVLMACLQVIVSRSLANLQKSAHVKYILLKTLAVMLPLAYSIAMSVYAESFIIEQVELYTLIASGLLLLVGLIFFTKHKALFDGSHKAAHTAGTLESAKAVGDKSHDPDSYGMRWYHFLISFGLVAGAIGSVFSSYYYAKGSFWGDSSGVVFVNNPFIKGLDLAIGAAYLLIAVFQIAVRRQLATYSPNAHKYYLIMRACTFLAPCAYLVAISLYVKYSFFDVTNVSSIVPTGILFILELIYFSKRAPLFDGSIQILGTEAPINMQDADEAEDPVDRPQPEMPQQTDSNQDPNASTIRSLKAIRTIVGGGEAEISTSDIVVFVVNLMDARSNLSRTQEESVVELYNSLRDDAAASTMNWSDCFQRIKFIIKSFDGIAPYDQYCGNYTPEMLEVIQQLRVAFDKEKIEDYLFQVFEEYKDKHPLEAFVQKMEESMERGQIFGSRRGAIRLAGILTLNIEEGKQVAVDAFEELMQCWLYEMEMDPGLRPYLQVEITNYIGLMQGFEMLTRDEGQRMLDSLNNQVKELYKLDVNASTSEKLKRELF